MQLDIYLVAQLETKLNNSSGLLTYSSHTIQMSTVCYFHNLAIAMGLV